MASNQVDLQTLNNVKSKFQSTISKVTSAKDVANAVKRNTEQEVLNRNRLSSSLDTLVSDIGTVQKGIQDIISVLSNAVETYNNSNAAIKKMLSGLDSGLFTLQASSGIQLGTNVSNTTNVPKAGDPDFIGPLPPDTQLENTGATVTKHKVESILTKIRNKLTMWFKSDKSSSGATVTDGKTESFWSKLFGKNKQKNKDQKENKLDITDLSQDDNGGILWASEKTTLIDASGARVIYDKRKELADGTVEYYDKSGFVIKRILPDDSCEISVLAFGHKFYNAEGKSVGGSIRFSDIGGPIDADKLRIYPDGKKEYFEGKHLLRKEESDGSYIEYFTSGVWGSLETGELRIKKVYHADGTYETYKDTTNQIIDKKVQADGSYVHFDMEGNVIAKKLSDGTLLKYFPNGSKQVRFEEKSNGDRIEYDENGIIIEKEYNGGCLRGGITEKYSDGKLFRKSIGGKEEYYDESGKIRVMYDGQQKYTVYNADGTIDIYGKDQVENGGAGNRVPEGGKHLISFDLKDGTKRIISTNGEVMYDRRTNSYTTSMGSKKVTDFGFLVGKEKIANQLSELGIVVDSSNLPTTAYVYGNYDNGKCSDVDLYESGQTGKHGGCTFIRKITVHPNGNMETHEIYCELTEDAKKGYVPKDVFANPNAYISKIIEQN